MKILAINGSPHAKGNTYYALREVLGELEAEGFETELLHLGDKVIRGCMGCKACRKTGKCAFADEQFEEWMDKLYSADAIVLGSPVYFGGINGTLKSFLDRAFYFRRSELRGKVGAAVVAVRRGGSTSAVQQLEHYIHLSEMIMPPAFYWNSVHGSLPGEVAEDGEGMQNLRTIGRGMAWLLKMREGAAPYPEPEERLRTNFIR